MSFKISLKYLLIVAVFETVLTCIVNLYTLAFVNFLLLSLVLYMAIGFGKALGMLQKIHEKQIPGKVFHSILIAGLKDSEYAEALNDPNWDWQITYDGNHKYTIDGAHPVAKRIIIHTTYALWPNK